MLFFLVLLFDRRFQFNLFPILPSAIIMSSFRFNLSIVFFLIQIPKYLKHVNVIIGFLSPNPSFDFSYEHQKVLFIFFLHLLMLSISFHDLDKVYCADCKHVEVKFYVLRGLNLFLILLSVFNFYVCSH